MSKTIFCDIDGTILFQNENFLDWYTPRSYTGNFSFKYTRHILEGAREKLLIWHSKGYRIILTTGRPENDRKVLSDYLIDSGIYYHQLIMDCGSGERILINDTDPEKIQNKATAINLIRNHGIGKLEL